MQLEDADKIVETFRRVFHKSLVEKIAEKFIDIFLFGLRESCDIINSGGFEIDDTIKFMKCSGEAIALFGEGETPSQAFINAVQSCPNFNQWRMVLAHFTGNKYAVNNFTIERALPMDLDFLVKSIDTAREIPLIENLIHREVKIRWAKTIDDNAKSVKVAIIAACHESNWKRLRIIKAEGKFYIIGRG